MNKNKIIVEDVENILNICLLVASVNHVYLYVVNFKYFKKIIMNDLLSRNPYR